MILERRTFADVVAGLGGIALQRIRFDVKPGKATVRDLVRLWNQEHRLYELIDGLLVEKVMGSRESFLMLELAWHLRTFLERTDLGFLLGADGALEILPHLVRIPDLSFIGWSQRPEKTIPDQPVPQLIPDLAVEILSRGNTREEMERKLKEYFLAGSQAVWFVYPAHRTVKVHSSPEESVTLTEEDFLTGGSLLPGFSLKLKQLFGKLDA